MSCVVVYTSTHWWNLLWEFYFRFQLCIALKHVFVSGKLDHDIKGIKKSSCPSSTYPHLIFSDISSLCSVLSNFFLAPRTLTHLVSLSMELSRQEYCSALPFPIPGDLLDLGIEPMSFALPALHADSLSRCHLEAPSFHQGM